MRKSYNISIFSLDGLSLGESQNPKIGGRKGSRTLDGGGTAQTVAVSVPLASRAMRPMCLNHNTEKMVRQYMPFLFFDYLQRWPLVLNTSRLLRVQGKPTRMLLHERCENGHTIEQVEPLLLELQSLVSGKLGEHDRFLWLKTHRDHVFTGFVLNQVIAFGDETFAQSNERSLVCQLMTILVSSIEIIPVYVAVGLAAGDGQHVDMLMLSFTKLGSILGVFSGILRDFSSFHRSSAEATGANLVPWSEQNAGHTGSLRNQCIAIIPTR